MFPVRYGKPHPRRWPIPEPAKRVIENCDPWTYYRIFQTAGYSVAQKVQAIEEFCAVPPGTVSDCFPEINDRGIVGRLMRERLIEMKMALDKKSRAAGRTWENDYLMTQNGEGTVHTAGPKYTQRELQEIASLEG